MARQIARWIRQVEAARIPPPDPLVDLALLRLWWTEGDELRTACVPLGVLQRERLGVGGGHAELAASSMHLHLGKAAELLT